MRGECPDGTTLDGRRERRKQHKLYKVVSGPYKVLEVYLKTVVIRVEGKNVKRISRDRVGRASDPRQTGRQYTSPFLGYA